MKQIYVFCYIALLALNISTIKADPEAKVEGEQPNLELKKEDINQELINPIVDQDYTEKEHDKRTIFPTFNNFGWAKHVKVRGGQKVVLGYSPVDLKYVPVIKPFGKGGWRFRQRQPAYHKRRPVMHLVPVRPKPDTHGWKPIIPAHVPPPQQPGQHQGWNKPGVTILKPIRPSAPDHHHEHEHHDHHDHHVDHVDLHPVSVPVPTVVPTVIPTVVPTIVPEPTQPHVHVLDDHHHHHHGHVLGLGDFGPDHHHHQHVDYVHPVAQVPHVVYYNHVHPGIHVPKPDLPVLPLGATFPINVHGIHGLPGVVPTVHTPHHVDIPVSPAVPAYPGILPTAAGPLIPEIPHVHYTHTPHLVPQVPHYDIPAVPHHFNIIPHAQPIPEVVHEVPAPHLHPVPIPSPVVPIPQPQVPHYHINTPTNIPAVAQIPHPHPQYHVHEHIPEVHEHHADLPPVQPLPQPAVPHAPSATHIPIPTHNNIQSVEYHGHLAHLVKQHQHQLQQNAHQYVPEHYNPHILPGSTGALTSAFLNPGLTDLQIPEILPQHPNYPSSHDDSYYDQGQFYPDGVTQPAYALEPPNK